MLFRILLFLVFNSCFTMAYKQGAPCKMQHTLRPSTGKHGFPQISNPPCKLEVLDDNNSPITHYLPNVKYTVRIVSAKPIRAFLIQPRLATKEGFIIGHLRGGEFTRDDQWIDYGIKYQHCAPYFNNSITNTDSSERYLIRATWVTNRNLGPIQFYATLWQDSDIFWSEWQPKTGFLLPAGVKSRKESSSSTEEIETPIGIIESIAAQKPPMVEIEPPIQKKTIIRESLAELDLMPSPPPIVIIEPVQELQIEANELGDDDKTPDYHEESFEHDRTSLKTIQSSISNSFALPSNTRRRPSSGVTLTKANVASIASEGDSSLELEYVEEPHTDIRHFAQAQPIQPLPPSTTRAPREDPCVDSPCANGAECHPAELSDEQWQENNIDKFFCLCENLWTGQYCDVRDYCAEKKCRHGECRNVNETYECTCEYGFAGKNCDKECPSYLCKNGGTCRVNDIGQYLCDCVAGFTGETCALEIDECASNPCQNGGTCTDARNKFSCECPAGWMGHKCHRPCQNIYKSCKTWNRQNQCQLRRPETNFFDVNCAVACGSCEFRNETVTTDTPIPPLLEPFIFLLGEWMAHSRSHIRFPVDFDESTSGYDERITFSVTDVPMFGTPSINFTSIAVNSDNSADVQVTNGFLTIRPRPKDRLRVGLMTVGNDATTVVEEGKLEPGQSMELTPVYITILDQSRKINRRIERSFKLNGGFLAETVSKYDENGKRKYNTKYFGRRRMNNYF